MSFSYLKLHPTRRLFLIYYAAGYSVAECIRTVPRDDGSEGISEDTYLDWRKKDALFVEAMEKIKDDPDWCHEHIQAPWALALDDLMLIRKMLGHHIDPDRPWHGLSAKQRELLLSERGKLNREQSQVDKFMAFMERMEQSRSRRELAEQRQHALPAPKSIVIDASPQTSGN